MLAARQQRQALSASKAAERLQLQTIEKTVRYQTSAPPRGRAAACAPNSPRPPCSPRSATPPRCLPRPRPAPAVCAPAARAAHAGARRSHASLRAPCAQPRREAKKKIRAHHSHDPLCAPCAQLQREAKKVFAVETWSPPHTNLYSARLAAISAYTPARKGPKKGDPLNVILTPARYVAVD